MATPKYRVVGNFYDNWRMHENGEEVEYGGDPGENLEPLNAEAKKAKERALKMQPAPQPLSADERKELDELRALHGKAA